MEGYIEEEGGEHFGEQNVTFFLVLFPSYFLFVGEFVFEVDVDWEQETTAEEENHVGEDVAGADDEWAVD